MLYKLSLSNAVWTEPACTCKWGFKYSHPQFNAPMGIKKPLVNPATAAMTGERRRALTGKAQMRAVSRAIHV